MTKEVLISMRGLQALEETREEQDAVEIITYGEYYYRNGKHYVLYEEVDEERAEQTKTVFKFSSDFFEVTKKGLINVHMMFEKGKKNQTYYCTPYGNLLLEILARGIQLLEKEESIDVNVSYELEVNYQHIADCDISIHVKPRNIDTILS